MVLAAQKIQRTTHAFLDSELPGLVAQRIEECRGIMTGALKTIEACCGKESDSADQASNEEECEAAWRRHNRAREALISLRARERELSRNEFHGDCVDCGLDIGDDRLRIRPEATRCVECKDVHDRSQSKYAR